MPIELSSSVDICEDEARSWPVSALLELGGHMTTAPLTNTVINSVVDAEWSSLVSLLTGSGPAINVNAALRPNEYGYFSVNFTTQDTGVPDSVTMDLFVNISPTNDPPNAVNASINLGAATSYTLQEADFGFSDPNDTPADGFKSVVITGLPATGQLTLDGMLLAENAEISIVAIRDGKLVFSLPTPPAGSEFFGFQVRDNGGNEGCQSSDLSEPHTFTLVPALPPPEPPPPPTPVAVPLLNDLGLALLGVLVLGAAKRMWSRNRRGS
ncbi:hypothetical protein [Ottowia thiooxydans]|uniref:hypothetical protein n=1 Tax=Ottowia thiooxydans TaxID=219182 RepID=UPI000560008D|nr:hypothetical protein [Ottowia thiooxydans]